jgi:hypothetical protein
MIGDPRAAEALVSEINDAEELVRREAAAALKRIGNTEPRLAALKSGLEIQFGPLGTQLHPLDRAFSPNPFPARISPPEPMNRMPKKKSSEKQMLVHMCFLCLFLNFHRIL